MTFMRSGLRNRSVDVISGLLFHGVEGTGRHDFGKQSDCCIAIFLLGNHVLRFVWKVMVIMCGRVANKFSPQSLILGMLLGMLSLVFEMFLEFFCF